MIQTDLREHWDRQSPIYASEKGHQKFAAFLDLYEQSCWRYIEPVLPEVEASLILEAGCGTGRWVVRLAPMGYHMVLSDLSPEMIEHARDKVERLSLWPPGTCWLVRTLRHESRSRGRNLSIL